MGDEKTEYEIWLDEYANVSGIDLGSITVSGSNDVNYQDWLNDYVGTIDIGNDWNYESKLGTNDISLTGGGEEMLRVAQDGFYVRGIKVEADAKEAEAVYKAFKQWMTYAILNGEINN